MPDLDELHRLAPDVDTSTAVAAFRRRRHRARSWRRGAFAVAAALVLVVGAVAVLAQRDDRPTAVVAGPPTESGPVSFEVLAVASTESPLGTLRAAADPTTLEELWASSGADGAVPVVDLTRVVVVSITIPDGSCPPDLVRFDRDLDAITPVFAWPTPLTCGYPLIPKTYVVAIDRESVEPAFTLRLPGDERFEFGEQTLRVELGATPTSEAHVTDTTVLDAAEPPCAAVDALATSLVETGIAYDTDATRSPEELVAEREVVLIGTLTGETEQRETGPDDSLTPARWIGFRVAVQTAAKGTPDAVDGVATVWVQHYGDRELAARRALDAAGTPVVVFADVHPEVGLQTAVEGIITACPGGPLIGQHVSTQGDWPAIATLDDLVARVEAAAG